MPRTKEQARQYNQTYYAKHKEKLKKQSIEYYENNKDKVLTTVSKYREKNRDLLREKDKAYNRRPGKREIRMLNAAKSRAKEKNLEFNITVEDIVIPEKCPLLGIELMHGDGTRKTCKSSSPSLDRIDSSKGYIKGNVWVISHKANTIKSNSTYEEFAMMAKKWKKYQKLFDRMVQENTDVEETVL
jgi:hypothetical protein